MAKNKESLGTRIFYDSKDEDHRLSLKLTNIECIQTAEIPQFSRECPTESKITCGLESKK